MRTELETLLDSFFSPSATNDQRLKISKSSPLLSLSSNYLSLSPSSSLQMSYWTALLSSRGCGYGDTVSISSRRPPTTIFSCTR